MHEYREASEIAGIVEDWLEKRFPPRRRADSRDRRRGRREVSSTITSGSGNVDSEEHREAGGGEGDGDGDKEPEEGAKSEEGGEIRVLVKGERGMDVDDARGDDRDDPTAEVDADARGSSGGFFRLELYFFV